MYAVDTKAITDQSDKNQMVKTTGAFGGWFIEY